jgi:diguanylate cyclase (GGDEF)-like protein
MSRRDLDEDNQSVVINDAMGPFCVLGAVMFGIVSFVQFRFDSTPGSWWSSGLAALTGVFLAVSFLVLHSSRADVLRRNPLRFGTIITGLVAANPMIYILGTGVTYPAIGILLVIVALGALIHNRFWATSTIVFVDVFWILCAVAFGVTGVPFATFISQMVKANALAIVLNIARRRTVRRFETAQREVHRLATTDELTGLANQRGLYEVVREIPGKLRKKGLDLTVVYVDVDDLKSVNDRYGHAAGDALIRSVAEVLRAAFREHDTIARVGGDEFAVLITSPSQEDAEDLVERAHQRLADKGISASLGSASASSAAPDFDTNTLLERADAAMYEAKMIRKNGMA